MKDFRGFKRIEAVRDNPIGGAHSKVLAWYAGTVDQGLSRIDNEFVYEEDGVEIQDRKGEVNVENWYDRELDPIDGYEGFDANIETENGTTKFVGNDFEAVLDGEHLDKSAHPDDLLNTHLAPGMRKLPSELDVEILQALIATELEKNGSNPAGDELLAALTSDPLLAIANGDFSISDTTTDSFAWDTRGASGIEDGQAVLTEDSPFLSNFTQTFTVPESAKTIQF